MRKYSGTESTPWNVHSSKDSWNFSSEYFSALIRGWKYRLKATLIPCNGTKPPRAEVGGKEEICCQILACRECARRGTCAARNPGTMDFEIRGNKSLLSIYAQYWAQNVLYRGYLTKIMRQMKCYSAYPKLICSLTSSHVLLTRRATSGSAVFYLLDFTNPAAKASASVLKHCSGFTLL